MCMRPSSFGQTAKHAGGPLDRLARLRAKPRRSEAALRAAAGGAFLVEPRVVVLAPPVSKLCYAIISMMAYVSVPFVD